MKNENIKSIAKGICFIAVFVLLFCFFQVLFQAKWIDEQGDTSPTSTWTEFYSLEPDTVDALFIGTSHVYYAIDPMYIYKNSGITSYVLSGSGLRFDLSYMVLEDALKTQNPKVVFLDMSSLHFKAQQSEGKCHKITDQLPISRTKIEYAFNNGGKNLPPLDVLFPFFRYHSRWDDLGEKDFRYITGSLEETVVRGHYINYSSVKTTYPFYGSDKKRGQAYVTERNMEYLSRIAKICEENGIQLVLMKIPTPRWYHIQSEASQKIADELGVPFLELFYKVDEIGLAADSGVFKDKTSHLNQIGAEKLCDYMMQYMQQNYELADQRGKNEMWDEDLILYENLKESIRAAAT